MKQYLFVTQWFVDAPRETVWTELTTPDYWPEWWHGVRSVELLARGAEDGVDSIVRYTFRGVLPYDLVFDMRTATVDAPRYLDGHASGDLVGTGRWYLAAIGKQTSVRYEWDVATRHWWMNVLSPLAAPVFRWNHNMIMRWGEEGLRSRLGLPPREPEGTERRPVILAAALAAALGLLAVTASRRRQH